MALVLSDRVRETSTTTGTGTFTLAGAVDGYRTFSGELGNGNTTFYCIQNQSVATEFETGIGTIAAGTLARTTPIESSNGGAAVNFSAGTKDVFCTFLASRTPYVDGATIVAPNSTLNGLLRGNGSGTISASAFAVDTSGHVTSFGGQIKFPATQAASADANTLDDYEEGTWTPADGSGAGLSFTFNSGGQYEKIGRQVRASCGISYPITADGGTAYVSGLPFTVGSSESNRQGLFSITNRSTINGVACVPGDTKCDFRKSDINQMTNAEMDAALVYFTTIYAV